MSVVKYKKPVQKIWFVAAIGREEVCVGVSMVERRRVRVSELERGTTHTSSVPDGASMYAHSRRYQRAIS
jgi:hypothetical protein